MVEGGDVLSHLAAAAGGTGLLELVKWLRARSRAAKQDNKDIVTLVLEDRRSMLAEARGEIKELKTEVHALESDYEKSEHENRGLRQRIRELEWQMLNAGTTRATDAPVSKSED